MQDALLLRSATALPLLLYSSYLDLRYREIHGWVWKSMMLLGLLYIGALREEELLPFILLTLSTAIALSLLLHRTGLIGGGDAKLLIALALLFPFQPPGRFLFPFFFLSVFSNAVLLALPLPLFFLLHNLKDIGEARTPGEVLRLLVAYKKDARAIGRYEAPVERGRLFLSVHNVELGRAEGEGEIWVTPALPFAAFLTAGFLISLAYGDLLALLL